MPFLLPVRNILSISKSGVIQRLSQARNCKTGHQWDDSVSLTVHKLVEARAEQLSLDEIFPLKRFVHNPWRTSLSLLLFYKIPHFELDTSLRYFSIENINSFPDRVDV